MVMLNGTIGTVFSIVLYNNFTSWLTFLGSTLPAIGAIIITYFYFVNKRIYFTYEKAAIIDVYIPAIIAWVVGYYPD